MILTAQEEYGLRCALSLARAQMRGEMALTLGEVAEREGMTTAYAGKILRLLVHAGLIESTRGRQGGYSLSREASQMPLSHLLQALGSKFYDGEICQRPAPGASAPARCVHNSNCSLRSLWGGLQGLIDGYLSGLSLADLAGNEEQVESLVQTRSAEEGRQQNG